MLREKKENIFFFCIKVIMFISVKHLEFVCLELFKTKIFGYYHKKKKSFNKLCFHSII